MDEYFSARVESIGAGGAGVTHHNGLCVFVPLSAPGDLLRVRIKRMHRTYSYGEIVEIEEPSPMRIAPRCPLFGVCGGCSLQQLDYRAQCVSKVLIVQSTLSRIGKMAHIPDIYFHCSPAFAYRNRVQFHKTGRSAGFVERTGTKVIPLEDCPIADPGIRHALQERRILIPPDRDRWTVYSRGETFLSEAGTNHGKIQILDREIFVEAGAFFQSNGTVLEYLIKDILDFTLKADPDRPAADLYGGVGTFGAFLQDYFPHLSIVEENPAAAPFIHKNVPAAKVVSGTVDQWLNNAPDLGFAVADPPRTGLSALTRSVLAKSGPPFLVYVSCNCATLARDLRVFLDSGYAIHRILVYDFYPQTAHIESAVFLEKGFVR